MTTFAMLTKGDRFQVMTASGTWLSPIYTKISKRVCKNANGDWLDVALTQPVRPVGAEVSLDDLPICPHCHRRADHAPLCPHHTDAY